MRAVIVGGGMGGLFTALALRESGQFSEVNVYEQTAKPNTAGAGLNIPPNGARLCSWLGIDLDGGDPKGPHGAVDDGRAAILDATREIFADGKVSVKLFDHNTAVCDGAGFHHMHRLDLLMCLHKRVLDFGPESGADCPIQVHMNKRLSSLSQTDTIATAGFEDGTFAEGELLIGADGINSKVLELQWPDTPPRRWTEVTVYRGLVPREKFQNATARRRQPDG